MPLDVDRVACVGVSIVCIDGLAYIGYGAYIYSQINMEITNEIPGH